jgi:hypothetical protein
MKNQVKWVAKFLISNLQSCFLSHDVMEGLGLVFPQYWMMEDCEDSFKKHINVIKTNIVTSKGLGMIKP